MEYSVDCALPLARITSLFGTPFSCFRPRHISFFCSHLLRWFILFIANEVFSVVLSAPPIQIDAIFTSRNSGQSFSFVSFGNFVSVVNVIYGIIASRRRFATHILVLRKINTVELTHSLNADRIYKYLDVLHFERKFIFPTETRVSWRSFLIRLDPKEWTKPTLSAEKVVME